MADKNKILEVLEETNRAGSRGWAAAGFDVVIDTIVRIICGKDLEGKNIYFSTIEDFGKHLISKKGMSCSVEMELQQEKIGGNMAIFSHCLGRLGVKTHCMGSMGYPEIQPIFTKMSENCCLHSVCNPGQCNAMEFQDGKVMLSSMDNLMGLTWELLCERMGQETLIRYFRECNLAALLNWSELVGSTLLFRHIFERCIYGDVDKKKMVLLDLSDASRKSSREILEVLKLGEEINRYRTTIFSMNENECRLIYHALFGDRDTENGQMGREIRKKLTVDYLIVHLRDCAYAYTEEGEIREEGYFTEAPKLSTGGGDNFNGGLCFGLLQGLSLENSLKLGNATSGYYVRTGKSPDIAKLIEFLRENGRQGRSDD